jgi:TonB family protein
MPEVDTERKSSRRLWIFAGLGAIALHAGGGALAIAHLRVSDPDETFGAPAIQIGLEMGSPELDPTDLPPGLDSEASVASPALAEQKAEFKESQLPKDNPTSETDDADRAVTRNDSKRPQEHDARLAAVETSASQESVAAAATARQSLDVAAPKTEVATAPNIGLGKDTRRLKAKWESKLSAYLQSHLRYPKDRKNKNKTVALNLVFNRLGHVLSVSIDKSSGDRSFDDAAISTVRRSDPLPRPPAALTDEQFSYILPMKFTDRN